jgi:hypothetical protein
VTVPRNARLDDPAQLRNEQVALVGAHHQYAAERIRLQQPGEGIAVLPVVIDPFELVSYKLKSLVEAQCEIVSLGSVDLNRHVLSPAI